MLALAGTKKEGSAFALPSVDKGFYPFKLEGELNAKTNDRLVFAVAQHVPCAISEDAHAACGRKAKVNATANEEITAGVGVGAETTANHGVRSQAKAGDGVAQDQRSVELMMSAVGSVDAIGTLEGDVWRESVFSEDTTAEHVISAIKQSAAECTEGEARSEAFAAGWSRRWQDGCLRVLVGDRASESGAAKGNRCDDGQE